MILLHLDVQSILLYCCNFFYSWCKFNAILNIVSLCIATLSIFSKFLSFSFDLCVLLLVDMDTNLHEVKAPINTVLRTHDINSEERAVYQNGRVQRPALARWPLHPPIFILIRIYFLLSFKVLLENLILATPYMWFF